MRRTLSAFAAMVPLLLGLPLLGVWLAGHDLRQYLEFPPLTRYVEHAAFSGWGFGITAAVALAGAAALAWGVSWGRRRLPAGARPPALRTFPWWGWAGMGLGLTAWILAWTRFGWFAPWQRHTFIPLWLAYILVVSALCHWRGGRCLLRERPRGFLLLFPASAVFWWFFEYLNRFVQNWYYCGVESFGPVAYVIMATVSFSTVLPAVMATHDLLLTFPALGQGLSGGVQASGAWPKPAAGVALALAGAGLAFVGVLPNQLFPLLWVSPFLIVLALQVLREQCPILDALRRGDWHGLVAAPLAGLVCGGFWEMWNILSLAKWEYAVPFVDRFHIFEMPLVGYAGYLPFGLECLVIGQLILEAVGDGPPLPSAAGTDGATGRSEPAL